MVAARGALPSRLKPVDILRKGRAVGGGVGGGGGGGEVGGGGEGGKGGVGGLEEPRLVAHLLPDRSEGSSMCRTEASLTVARAPNHDQTH